MLFAVLFFKADLEVGAHLLKVVGIYPAFTAVIEKSEKVFKVEVYLQG